MGSEQRDLPISPGEILDILDFAKTGYSRQDTPVSGTNDPSTPYCTFYNVQYNVLYSVQYNVYYTRVSLT